MGWKPISAAKRKTYRMEFAPRIARVLDETAGKPLADVRRALRGAFPMGIRKYWPYKVWLSEVRKQLAARRIGPTARPNIQSCPLFPELFDQAE